MRIQKTDAVFFSVYQADQPESVNVENHEATLELLDSKGVKYKVIDGVYMGEIEKTIIVSAMHLDLASKLCREFKQESYLRQEIDGQCSLVFLTGGTKRLGEMRVVTEEEIRIGLFESYSYCKEYGKYFAAY